MSVEDGQQIQNYDLVIVGAGIYGIQAARTFLELHPSAKVAVLEASGSIGGVWSQGENVRIASSSHAKAHQNWL